MFVSHFLSMIINREHSKYTNKRSDRENTNTENEEA
uniref:Uncharacterized protein n=1 Tax=Arundo donax TaxID=35708 RepID=A0A0A9GV82_ARUDO